MIRYLNKHAKWTTPVVGIAVCAGAMSAAPQIAAAQNAAAKKAAPARQTAPAATKSAPAAPRQAPAAAKSAPPSSAELAAREQILKSDEWRDVLTMFDTWLSKQTLYDAEQVARTRQRLEIGIKRMTSTQLQRFVTEMNAKLEVLKSDHATDAQDYLNETLSVASEAYARKVRQQLPDVLSMNAAQIDQKLAAITSKRAATAKMQKTFDNSRQRMVASYEAQTRARQRDQQAESADRANAYPKQNNFTPAADYYPNVYDAYDTGYDGYAGVNLPLDGYRF
jgi:hypothetical protein